MPQRERGQEKTRRKQGRTSCRHFLQMNNPTSVTVGIEELFCVYEHLDGKDRNKFKLCVISDLHREVAWRILNPDGRTHRLSRNVGKKLPLLAAWQSRRAHFSNFNLCLRGYRLDCDYIKRYLETRQSSYNWAGPGDWTSLSTTGCRPHP